MIMFGDRAKSPYTPRLSDKDAEKSWIPGNTLLVMHFWESRVNNFIFWEHLIILTSNISN